MEKLGVSKCGCWWDLCASVERLLRLLAAEEGGYGFLVGEGVRVMGVRGGMLARLPGWLRRSVPVMTMAVWGTTLS